MYSERQLLRLLLALLLGTLGNGGMGQTSQPVQASVRDHSIASVSRKPPLSAIACPNTIVCYAVGGSILGTTDSGNTWMVQHQGRVTIFNSLACPTSATCYATLTKPAGGSEWKTRILVTTNGGISWLQTYATNAYGLFGLACPRPTVCHAVGGISSTATGQFRAATILLTSRDSGRTWSRQRAPGIFFDALTCPTKALCYAMGQGMLVTRDGGRHWEHQPIVTDVGSQVRFFGAACVTVSTCFAAAAYGGDEFGNPGIGVILATTDGGETWHEQHTMQDWDGDILHFACPGPSTCFTVGLGTGIVLATRDAGRTWVTKETGWPSLLLGIDCPSIRVCYADGLNFPTTSHAGIILTTEDGGMTWHRL